MKRRNDQGRYHKEIAMKIGQLSDRVAARLNRAQLRPYHPSQDAEARRRARMEFELRVIREVGARRA
ncbi:hypothetical protein ACMU_14050 [Actibacterium mucosum KCTC 23349]|uniref:Uncharacterized protein n=2 Tax=Actibacterium TaxID=1433986 RepID=A0A037ZH78_9RHOB|nr:hypothetical protein ACMU_14050 [Actibacterium mucosum KCTC 23349]